MTEIPDQHHGESVLDMNVQDRAAVWAEVLRQIEAYRCQVASLPTAAKFTPEEVRETLRILDFAKPCSPMDAVTWAADGLRRYQVHAAHPRHFGLFVPSPTEAGIMGEALAAAFNPQLAAWAHSPFAVEVETHLIRVFGARFGYQQPQLDGTFTNGGAEANQSALITALAAQFPGYLENGLRGFDRAPAIYVNAGAHPSFVKAARLCGLGTAAVRVLAQSDSLVMDLSALQRQLEHDIRAGYQPVMIVATAGTTVAGSIDPLKTMAQLAQDVGAWLHVDAAWAGAVALVDELRPLLDGIEQADSITFDPHKWLSIPMGAGMLLTRHPGALERAFSLSERPDYMPGPVPGTVDPYCQSMQWSRRFIGLKVCLSLMTLGWDGYADAIRHQIRLADLLRIELAKNHWQVLNSTHLPVVCFVDSHMDPSTAHFHHAAIADAVVASGKAWISSATFAGRQVLRACVSNHGTTDTDVRELVELLCALRQQTNEDHVKGLAAVARFTPNLANKAER